ncbi:glutamate--cysteine ligase [Sphaerisporangium krabiense]|uniref:Gamma-glutamyl:cysteine ligase YbdK (ATP-grasp superfamily) n=1 Tax=Sphaerisporangium krabiense TaxID=763782 RepID=A0A7W9DU35_9ACTN|nr:glutamate--cysteine ligase [Sphaerisporangium krabiense]MBB5630699.1 gamma-glutamyl:cysteine ligase YbdK (ATP-grasp superfamily) [Sphaerisporangium krabiense]
MGQQVAKERFSEDEYARFGRRLEDCLLALRELLSRPGFGAGPASVGAELELFLIDEGGRPLRRNKEVREAAADERVVLELGSFNLEVNLTPLPLAGRPFSAMEDEARLLIGLVDQAARTHGGRVVPIGILPTLSEFDFTRDAISDEVRYRALSRGMRRVRDEPYRVRIDGAERLDLEVEDVILESANTSWQVHLRTSPGDFARVHNAAQLAIGPVLAVSGNSPSFLGRELWEETRIALFEASADDRDAERPWRVAGRVSFGSGWVRSGAEELFEQSVREYEPVMPVTSDEDPLAVVRAGGVPGLAELRLHQGTVWQWNRPVYDPADGGHLRVELRALPAGPTCADMAANAAFLLGLVAASAANPGWIEDFPFADAYRNFYRAARGGLDAVLAWPGRPESVPASELVLDLLPVAHDGLLGVGVAEDEARERLAVIRERVRAGRTGAVWQRRALAALGEEPNARAAMLARYRELAHGGEPVHTWPDMEPLSMVAAETARPAL